MSTTSRGPSLFRLKCNVLVLAVLLCLRQTSLYTLWRRVARKLAPSPSTEIVNALETLVVLTLVWNAAQASWHLCSVAEARQLAASRPSASVGSNFQGRMAGTPIKQVGGFEQLKGSPKLRPTPPTNLSSPSRSAISSKAAVPSPIARPALQSSGSTSSPLSQVSSVPANNQSTPLRPRYSLGPASSTNVQTPSPLNQQAPSTPVSAGRSLKSALAASASSSSLRGSTYSPREDQSKQFSKGASAATESPLQMFKLRHSVGESPKSKSDWILDRE